MTRVYRTSRGQHIGSIVLIVVGLLFLIAIWSQVLLGRREPKVLEMAFPLLFLGIAGAALLRDVHSRVSLSEATIEVRCGRSTVSLALDKIEGRRKYTEPGDGEGGSVKHLVLVPNDDRLPRVDIEETYAFDDFFYTWFNALPDLDERDKKRRTPPVIWGGSIPT